MTKMFLENKLREIGENAKEIFAFSGMQNNLAIRMRAKKILKNTNQLRKKLMEIKVMKK